VPNQQARHTEVFIGLMKTQGHMTAEKINNYCTDQNLIVRYPNGAGGKFLITCLFLFKHVAHWDQDVQHGKVTHWDWFRGTWPQDISQWTVVEPNHPWNTNFFSRRLSRNNELTSNQYNSLVGETASDYFFESWQQGHKIVDHFHKKIRTDFQHDSEIIDINLVNQHSIDLYKEMIKQKLWLWNDQTKIATSTLDHPDFAHDTTSHQHRLQFNNQYLITGYNSYDELFDNYLAKQEFIKPFMYASADASSILSIDFADLYRFETLVAGLEQLEQHYNQTIDKDLLRRMHVLWKDFSRI
jgi:hypothetical protein